MVKVNLKSTKLFSNLTLFNLLFFTISLITIQAATLHSVGYLLLSLEFTIFYVLLLFYIVKILSHLNENASTAASFTMLACLLGIGFFNNLFPSLLKGSYANYLGPLTEIVALFVVFQSFKIKNNILTFAFKLFGISLFLSFSKLILVLTIPSINEKNLSIYSQFTIVALLLSARYLLKMVTKYLKIEDESTIKTVTESL